MGSRNGDLIEETRFKLSSKESSINMALLADFTNEIYDTSNAAFQDQGDSTKVFLGVLVTLLPKILPRIMPLMMADARIQEKFQDQEYLENVEHMFREKLQEMSEVIVLNFREGESSDGARDNSDGSSGNRNDGSNRCACRCTCYRTCRTRHNTSRHTTDNLVERARLEPMLINLPVARHDNEGDRVGAVIFESIDAEVKHALVAKRVEVIRSLNILRQKHHIFVIGLASGGVLPFVELCIASPETAAVLCPFNLNTRRVFVEPIQILVVGVDFFESSVIICLWKKFVEKNVRPEVSDDSRDCICNGMGCVFKNVGKCVPPTSVDCDSEEKHFKTFHC